MAKFEKHFYDRLGRFIDKRLETTAIKVQRNVKASMFMSGPTLPGRPPGVETGTLRRSIHYKKAEENKWLVGTNLVYGFVHEFGGRYGNRFYPARPFLRPIYLKLIT